jgi:hypothetical protein
MWKFSVSAAVLGIMLFMVSPVMAGGPHHGGYYGGGHGNHGYHGGYGQHVYYPPVYRPRYVYPAPYVVPQPIFPQVYQPVYPYGYYTPPGGSFYLQGRNFSFGVGF